MPKSKNFFGNISKEVNDKLFWRSMHFSWFLFKKNILFWIFSVLLFLAQPVTILILNILKLDLINNSMIISLVPLLFLMLFDFFIINKLFSESKTNSIDYLFLSLPIKKSKIFFSRFLFIFFISFLLLLLTFIMNLILIFSFKIDLTWLLFFFVSNIFIEPFINILLISLIIIFALCFKKTIFSILSVITLIFVSSPFIFRSVSNNENFVSYNKDNSNIFSKISLTTNNKNIETIIVDEINNNYIKDNKNIIKQINSSPIYSYLCPGEIVLTFDSMLIKNIFDMNEDQIVNKKFSLLKNHYESFNFSNFENNEYINAIALRPNDINPLLLNNVEYEDLLMKNIDIILKDTTNFVNLSDTKYVLSLIDILTGNPNWNGKINSKEVMTLNALLGLNTKYSQLFYYQRDYAWLNQKTPNILKKIEAKYSLELSKLFSFLWTNEITQNNINNTFNENEPIFPKINDIYPTVKILDLNDKPSNFDIKFIKDDLVRYQGGMFSYLNTSGSYTPTTLLPTIDASIINKESWDLYVDKNTMSVNDAKNMINTLSSKLKDLSFVNFSNNKINLNKYSYFFHVDSQTYLTNGQIYVTALVFIIVALMWISNNKFERTNYKNFDIE